MKKKYISCIKFLFNPLLCLTLLMLSSCREGTTNMLNPDSTTTNDLRSTFLGQMITIWEGINTSYVFWEIDTVDWDARRDTMYNWAKRMDKMVEEDQTIDFMEESLIFNSFFIRLIDHHMSIRLVNPIKGESDFTAMPASFEWYARRYTHYELSINDDEDMEVFRNTFNNTTVRATEVRTASEGSQDDQSRVLSCVINDSIAYLRMSNYTIGKESSHSYFYARALFGHFRRVKEMKLANKLKAIILDNRGNGGGYMDDLNWVVGLYIDKPLYSQYIKTKNGLGKYDYTPEQPIVILPNVSSEYYVGDLGNVKYVVLQDAISGSMGEVSGNAIIQLPTGCTIGDRTFGAHGALNPGNYDVTWTGPFGYIHDNSTYVYTSTYLTKTWNWETKQFEYQEGKGLKPMIESIFTMPVNMYSSGDIQLLRAIQYINTGK